MAGNTFYLKIIAANRVFYAGRCRSLIVPEYDGQKEILAHHEDMSLPLMRVKCVFSRKVLQIGNMQ